METSVLNLGQGALLAANANDRSNSVKQSEPGVVIEITPSDENVLSGNRSQNSAEINVTSQNNEFSTEITREQFFNSLERRSYQNAYGSATSSSNLYQNPETASLAFQQSLSKTYATSYSYANNMYSYGYSTPSPYSSSSIYQSSYSSQSAYGANGVAMYNQAMNSYIQQSLFFSAVA